ncbi:MAG: WG repeat-containing protein, partial [Bacteroidaceae bacterium]|nr:WG repeat-containing protein [Bacteroidaceae bacterium]
MKHYDALRFFKAAATVFVLGFFWWLSVCCAPKENANVTQIPLVDGGKKFEAIAPFSEGLAAVKLN